MLHIRSILPAVLMLAISAGQALGATYAFTGANVLPMNEDIVLNDVTVLVEDGIIVAIAPSDSVEVPPEAQRIDASGRWLIPGLADMHTHLGLRLPGEPDANYQALKAELPNFLPNGVTTIRNMRSNSDVLRLRQEIRAGKVTGPRIFAAGPSLNHDRPLEFGPNITTEEQARGAVLEQAALGYDFIKVHQSISDAAFAQVISAANELGIKVAGHAQTNGGLDKSFALDSIEHAEELDKLLPGEDTFADHSNLLLELVRSGTVVVPTLTVFSIIPEYLSDEGLERLLAQRQTHYVSQYWLERMGIRENFFRQAFGPEFAQLIPVLRSDYERLQRITMEIHQAGVPLALGTDAVGLLAPGFSVHQELQRLVEAGLSPYEALRSATYNAMALVDQEHRLGALFVGAEADLVLLEANPLDDITNSRRILGVMAAGQWLDKSMLDQQLLQAKNDFTAIQTELTD